MAISEEAVWARLDSAEQRAQELVALPHSDPPDKRHQLAQEFFFHLGGAIEFTAQLAAQNRGLGDPDEITMSNVADKLARQSPGDPLEQPLRDLYVNLRKTLFPTDPYSDEGLLWRVFNYRHQVTHRGTSPFQFNLSLGGMTAPTSHFHLDPLDPSKGASALTIADDMAAMLDLVRGRIAAATGL